MGMKPEDQRGDETGRLYHGDGSIETAFITEHPSDDGEVITPEWLQLVGGKESWRDCYPVISFEHGLVYNVTFGDWSLLNYGRLKKQPRSRGDLRRLCSAIGARLVSKVDNQT